MFKRFLVLEWRAFVRSASFGSNLAMKILMGFLAVYFTLIFLGLGFGLFYLLREQFKLEPVDTVNKFMIYYLFFDLIFRLFLQKIPVMNIRPLLPLPIKKQTIVNFALGKTALSFFNVMHLFFLLPFTVVIINEGYDAAGSWCWFIGMVCLIYCNNFLNILLNNKDNFFVVFLAVAGAFAALHYYGVFDISDYTFAFFDAMRQQYWLFLVPLLALVILYLTSFNFFRSNLHFDTGLSRKSDVAKTEQFDWLNQFGTVGTFIKNDIRLIKRNKRSKTTVFMSFLFLFYGLLFFTGAIEVYDHPVWKLFGGLFVTGGFLFTFGQYVPSWDSSYYNLMMTQNISYKGYLRAKWWLIVVATLISAVLASFYLLFGWNTYLMILAGMVYNVGVNAHIVLLSGAYTKSPIDLTSSKNAFGDKKAMNMKTMLLIIPKLMIPLLLYWLGSIRSESVGLGLVVLAGILGFALRDKMFTIIEGLYKSEKYSTIEAYKQNNT